MTERFPRIVLVVLVVGLALHNLVMAELWDAGVRGASLDVIAAWKDALLAAALVIAILGARSLPFRLWADRFALAYAAIVVVYWLLPQSWLDGVATEKGQLFAARHHLIPVAAYFLGRLLVLTPATWRRISLALVGVAAAVTVWGLVDVYLVPLQWWRDSGVPGWFEEQLGLVYSRGLSGLPENWVLDTGDEANPIRRLTSTFLSPLATAYVLVIVLLYLIARRQTGWTVALIAVSYAGLLWTHTRAAYLALAVGLVVLAVAQRRLVPVALAAASLIVGVGFVKAFPTIGPIDQLHQRRARDSAAARPGATDGQRRPTQRRRRLDLQPPPQPSRRHPYGCEPPPGIRIGQRRCERLADDRRQDQGGRVDLHGARGRYGACRRPRIPRLGGCRPHGPLAPVGVAQRCLGCDARDRDPDRRDRRPLDRLRALRARRRGYRTRPARRRVDRMRALALRIGLYRVAAILIGGALVLELIRVQVLSGGSAPGAIICTVGEVAFMAAAAGTFVAARRRSTQGRSEH